MEWYHGTPDVRDLKGAGGFTFRSEMRRFVRDVAGLEVARVRAAEIGPDADERAQRIGALDAFFERIEIPVPVFLAKSRATAESYADDRRAFDYQNAEPAVLEAETAKEADVTINAGGLSFRQLSWVRIEAGLLASGREPEVVWRALVSVMGCELPDRIRVADLGAALWLSGCEIVDVRNVVDTHNGKGRPDTVRMVFDHALIRIPDFEPCSQGMEP